MQPEARVAAAIEILDEIFSGASAERSLTTWGRKNRFAGSGDRAAIRDLVFDALRHRRSYGWLGGGDTGRGVMLGALRAGEALEDEIFTGERFAPAQLNPAERAGGRSLDVAPEAVRFDCPDWLWPIAKQSYGEEAAAIFAILQERAPVFLRVNTAKTTRTLAAEALQADDVLSVPNNLAETALEVTQNARRVRNSRAFLDGWVELQDAASQAVVEQCVPYFAGRSVLDFCAGGGGKSLAFAAGGAASVVAHDGIPKRMQDIPARAARAGADIRVCHEVTGEFDFVFCDVPCSGSGAWRRQPEAKWTLDPEELARLNATQDEILVNACRHVAPGGHLGYATCSILPVENGLRVEKFLAREAGWRCHLQQQWTPLDGGDGFFLAVLSRA